MRLFHRRQHGPKGSQVLLCPTLRPWAQRADHGVVASGEACQARHILGVGFYDPDVGDIEIGGRRVKLPAHRRGTAMVFQDYALFPHMTVHDNVACGLRVARVSGADRERHVKETLAGDAPKIIRSRVGLP